MPKVCKAPPREKRGIYDWDELCDGKTREMKPGIDFKCQVISFRIAFYNACFDRGRVGSVNKRGASIYITARPMHERKRRR